MIYRTQGFTPTNGVVTDGYDSFQALVEGVDAILVEHPNSLAQAVVDIQKTLVDGYAFTNLLPRANNITLEEGQTFIYNSITDTLVPGASGDSSLKLQSITATGTLLVKGGKMFLGNGREIATYDGTGTLTSDFFTDLSFDVDSLSLIENGSILSNTTYYVYIDLSTILPTTIAAGASQGRKVYGVTSSNFVLSAALPDTLNLFRYAPLGFIRNIGGANSWSTTVVDTLAFRRHDRPIGSFSPVVYTNSLITVASVGNIAHGANINPEDQFWTAQLNGIDGYVSQLSDNWLVDVVDANNVEVDFSFLAVGDTVTLKLENRGLTNLGTTPVKTYTITAPANAISLPLGHGLSGVPTSLSLMQEIVSGEFEPLDFGSFLSVTNTQIKGSLAPLTTTVVKIVASVGAEAVSSSFYRTKIVAANTSIFSGDEFLVDTSAPRVITLPSSPSTGDRVRIIDFTGNAATNNITVGRNSSNIEAVASDFIINANRGSIELVYSNGTQGWIILSL
jgi:hypothetical protein